MANVGLYDSASEVSSLVNDDISDTYSLSDDGSDPPGTQERSPREESSTAAQAAKAIEAADDNTPNLTDGMLPVSSPVPRLPVWADEQTPLLDAGPAPPD